MIQFEKLSSKKASSSIRYVIMVNEERYGIMLDEEPTDDIKPQRDKQSPWNSLELTRIGLEVTKIVLLSILIPVCIFLFSREFKAHDQRIASQQGELREQAAKREAAAREQQAYRRVLWEQIAPKLNKIYSYFLYDGDWKETNRSQILALKRDLDATMYTNKAFFSKPFFDNYLDFTKATFNTFTGWGQDARLRTVPIRKLDMGFPASYFTCEDNGKAIFFTYWKLQDSASTELFGLRTLNPRTPPELPTDYLQLAKNSACGKLIVPEIQ